jgi:hypothetical protein
VEVRKLVAILATVILFGLAGCSAPYYKPKGKLSLKKQQLITNEKGDCHAWVESYNTNSKKERYLVISDVSRVSPYAIYDSKSKMLHLKNKVIENVWIGEIINYNPECKIESSGKKF